jgi:hypothetical protein
MSTSQPAAGGAPIAINTSKPKTIGVLNIIFGILMILAGAGLLSQAGSQEAAAPMLAIMQQQQQQAAERNREAMLAEMDAQIEAAETEEEKSELRLQKEMVLERSPQAAALDIAQMSQVNSDPRMKWYGFIDGATGVLLNVMLVVSGIGLLRFWPSGRALAVWTLALKLVRLVLVYGYAGIVIAPLMGEAQGKAVEQMMSAQGTAGPGGPPPGMFAMIYGVMYTVMAIAMVLFGSIYPAIALWILSRQPVKAAFEPAVAEEVRPFAVSLSRLFGVFNVALGILLVLSSLMTAASGLLLPAVGSMTKTLTQAVDQDIRKSNEKRIESLQEQIRDADDEAEKVRLRKLIVSVRTMPPVMPEFGGMFEMYRDRSFIIHTLISAGVGLVLNTLLAVSGFGLLKRRRWGRKLALFVAAAGLLTSAALLVASLLVVTPAMVAKMNEMIATVNAAAPAGSPPLPPGDFSSMYWMAAGMFLVGAIYPVLTLWGLNRPEVKAECQSAAQPTA